MQDHKGDRGRNSARKDKEMKFIVEYKNAGAWTKVKQVERRKNGTSCCKVIKFDSIEETEFTVSKYKNLGYEVRVNSIF